MNSSLDNTLIHFIIQHTVITLPKYGHGALNIRRPLSQQISCDIGNFVCRGEKWQNEDSYQLFRNKTMLCYQRVEYLSNYPAQSCGIFHDFSQLSLRPPRLSTRRYSARFNRIIVK